MHHGRHPYPSAVRETPGSLHKFCLTKLSARADTYCFELTAIPLDRFISYAVKVLRDGGIETYESCQARKGHSYNEPGVMFHGA